MRTHSPWAALRRSGFDKPLVAALVAAVMAGADVRGCFESLELKTLDWRFSARDRLEAWLGSPRPLSSRVALIEITDESLSAVPEPLLLWDERFAKLVSALTASSARVVACDVLWLKSVEDFVELKGPSPRKALARSFLAAARDGRLALASLPSGETGPSLGRYAAVIGADNFGFVNPILDPDREVRRLRTRFEAAPSFAGLAAQRFLGKLLPEYSEALIDYATGPLPFPALTFHEALARAEAGDRDYFEKNFGGRVVVIGTSAGVVDRHSTPIGRETPGLYVQAFAIETLLAGAPLRRPTAGWEALAVVLLCLASGALSFRWPAGPSAAAASGLGVLFTAASLLLFHRGVVIGLAGPVLAIPASFAAVFAYRFGVSDREKRRVSGLLKSYVNEKIVDLILQAPEGVGLRGQRRRVCVLFSDIRGFTQISEGLKPAEVVEFLNRYLSAMSDVILAHDGTVDKFIGDGIMAYFGAPLEDPKAALKAARSALAMQERLAVLNRQWERRGRKPLKIGIGIHMGEAIIGNIGSRRKMDFTAIGDAVNLASRIESLTKEFHAPILLTEDAYREISGDVEAEALGETPVRGHSPVKVYALKGLNHNATRRKT